MISGSVINANLLLIFSLFCALHPFSFPCSFARYSCSVCPGVGMKCAGFCNVDRSMIVEYPGLQMIFFERQISLKNSMEFK